MAKTSLVVKQKRPAKYKVRNYTRCNRCGRPRAVFKKFGRNRERVISGLKRVSKPGRRVYARKDRLPRPPLGVAILSTSTGLITARTAQERGIGGEVLCFVW